MIIQITCGAIRKLLKNWMIIAPHSKGRLRIVELDIWQNGEWGPENGTSDILECATMFQKLNEEL